MTDRAAVPAGGRAAGLAVAALGLFSATWHLGRPDWKLDEDAYARAGWSLVHDGVDLVEGHPPLAKLLYGGAQVVLGRDVSAVRSVAALGFLASAALLFAFGRRLGGWWTGIAAAGLFVVLPRTMVVGGMVVADLRIERHAILESIAAPLVLGALWCGWRWTTGDGARWAVAAGVLAGLAAATKLSAVVVLVPLVLVGGAYRVGRPRLGADVAGLVAAAVAAFLVPFLAFGRAAPHQVATVLRFPGERSDQGHRLVLGDQVWDRSPWWANPRYAWDADGPLLVAALVVGVALAVAARSRPAVAYLFVAVGVLAGSAMASPVALPHYRALWTPPLLLLVAVGSVAAVERVVRRPASGASTAPSTSAWSTSTAAVRAGATAGGAVLVVLALVGLAAVAQQATEGDGDYRTLARQVAADGVRPTKVLIFSEAVAPYFDGAYDSLAPFDDGAVAAQLVVLDPSLSDVVDAEVVERWRDWARSWGLSPHHVGRLEAWWAAP